MSEKRLIDANEIPYHLSGFPKGDGFVCGLDWAFREDIEKIPTVDAVEVVHGRWLSLEEYAKKIGADATNSEYPGAWVFCSECGQQMRNLYGWFYCPNCGAKMDGDGNG